MNENKIQVGILDDHTLFRAGIEQIVNDTSKYNMILSVDTPSKLFTKLKTYKIQILLLDLKLQEGSGQEVLIKMKKLYPLTSVIMLTMNDQESFIHSLIKQGANGYLLKDITPTELIETLDKVISYGHYYNHSTANIIVKNIQNVESMKTKGINFSSTELEMLRYLSEGHTAEQIGKKMHKGKRTIEGYRQTMLKETGCQNVAALIAWGFKNKVLG